MIKINVKDMDYKSINEAIRDEKGQITLSDCAGQRFIAAGMSDKEIKITGIPGNALGAYLNGAKLEISGNVQDAVGDTMNEGKIIVHGNIGDAAGYAMRGGEIFVKGNAGYRTGIHMKAYKEKNPVMVIGGRTGSFLGEYQAGGTIIVLGLHTDGKNIVGNYPSTGMHGGQMFLRGNCDDIDFPQNVTVSTATEADIKEIEKYIDEFCAYFDVDKKDILNSTFTKIVPDSKNPYKQMYVAN